MTQAAMLLELALEHHRAGEFQEAYGLYRQVLDQDPDHVDALTLLGTLASQIGDPDAAEALLLKAVVLDPQYPASQANLASLYLDQGRLDLAAPHMEQALELGADDPAILGNAAYLAYLSGNPEQARSRAEQALAKSPQHTQALNVLALCAMDRGGLAEARDLLDEALDIDPEYVEALANRGRVCLALGELEASLESLVQAVRLREDSIALWLLLAECMVALGRTDDAGGVYAHARSLDPTSVDVLKDWGAMLEQTGDCRAAEDKAREGLVLAPSDAGLWNNLGVAQVGRGALRAGIASLRKAVDLDPQAWRIRHNLTGRLMNMLGDAEAALPHLKAIADQRPGTPQHSGYLMGMQYCGSVDAEEIAAAHRDFAALFPVRALTRPVVGSPSPAAGRPMRVGFLSGDFRRHATARFLPPVLTRRAALGWEAVLYSLTPHEDEDTVRFRDMADDFVDGRALTDGALAQRIADDDLDVLFDLSGHTRFGAPAVFASRMARWQGGWIGLDYVWENGLGELDFVLTDAAHIPPEEDDLFRAKVLRLPHAYCYEAPPDAPPVSALPALGTGHVTFGCLNGLFKIGTAVIAEWAGLLHRCTGSRLVLGAPQLDHADSRTRIIELFAAHEIDAGRLTLLGATDPVGMLRRYHDIDIALDPFPYAGGLTTLEALWMGVPVVSAAGDRPAGRHSVSHLGAAGFDDLIAPDRAAVVERTLALAADLPRLAAWRGAARQRMQASSLCDGDRYARLFTQTLRMLIDADGKG